MPRTPKFEIPGDDEELERIQPEPRGLPLDTLPENGGVSLFQLDGKGDKRVDFIGITRTEPAEGYVGKLPPEATEADILARFGGSEFKIEAKNSKGKIIETRTIRIAGEPLFVSPTFGAKWRKAMGIEEKTSTPGGEAMSMRDLLVYIQTQQENAKREQSEREDRMKREALEHDAQRRREEQDREERRRRDDETREERRKREDEAREERQRRWAEEEQKRREAQHREDMERQAALNAQAMQMQSSMMQQMMAIATKREHQPEPQQDPLRMLGVAVDLMQKVRGEAGGDGGQPEHWTTIMARALPETLAALGGVGKGIVGEIVAGRNNASSSSDGQVTVTGPLAKRLSAIHRKAIEKGKDPDKVVDALIQRGMRSTLTQASAPALPAPETPATPLESVTATARSEAHNDEAVAPPPSSTIAALIRSRNKRRV